MQTQEGSAPQFSDGVFAIPSQEADSWNIQLEREALPVELNRGELSERQQRALDGQFKTHTTPGDGSDGSLNKSSSVLPVVGTEFGATAVNAWIPPDNTMAISQNGTIVTANNNMFEVFNDAGGVLYSANNSVFWSANNPTAVVYDPKVLYNADENKFVAMALHGSSSSLTEIYLAFSVSENPSVDGWWFYKITANVDDATNWFDYPNIGYSDSDFYVTGNMFSDAGSWQNTRVYSITEGPGHVGGSISWVYWAQAQLTGPNPNAFTIVPLQSYFGGYGEGIYMATYGPSYTDNMAYMNITAATSDSPLLQTFTVDVENWTSASGAAQLGSSDILDTGGDRIRSGFYGGNGKLHFAHAVDNGSGFAELRYHIIDVNTATATSSDFGTAGFDCTYPWIVPWATSETNYDQSAMIGYVRVSPTSYPEFRVVQMDANMDWSSSVQIQAGSSPINADRWGDYIGGCWREGQTSPEVWFYGQYGTGNSYGVWVAEILGQIEGCTDPSACNFNPDATADDGSCDLVSCLGCTSSTACNYDPTATIDDGSCTFPGCQDAAACNFDATAGCDSGDCCFEVCAQIYLEADFIFGGNSVSYNIIDNVTGLIVSSGSNTVIAPTFIDECLADGCYTFNAFTSGGGEWSITLDGVPLFTGNGDTSLPFTAGDGGGFSGCTDGSACNYSPAAICDDGSCVFPGCINPMACNYDDTAGCDDGSCLIPTCDGASGCSIADVSNTSFPLVSTGLSRTLTINSLDMNGMGNVVYVDPGQDISIDVSGDFSLTGSGCPGCLTQAYGRINGEYSACLSFNSSGPFTFSDLFAAPLIPGVYYMNTNYSWDFNCGTSTGTYPGFVPATGSGQTTIATIVVGDATCSGCTDIGACNYDAGAVIDDGSCTFPGCNLPSACNYDPTAGCDDGSCNLPDGCDDILAVNYCPSATGCDTGCLYLDDCGNIVNTAEGRVAGFFGDFDADNWTLGYDGGDGTVTFTEHGCTIVGQNNSSGGFDIYTSAIITVPVSGLYSFTYDYTTDDADASYDPAYYLNGTWVLITNPVLTFASGVVYVYLEAGDEFGFAVESTDSCCGAATLSIANFAYPGAVACTLGCTSSTACNFDPLATDDDGSCDHSCDGCTYPDADNFDPLALNDDGSCVFSVTSECPSDLNGDGSIGSADLLVILGEFGTNCNSISE